MAYAELASFTHSLLTWAHPRAETRYRRARARGYRAVCLMESLVRVPHATHENAIHC